MKWATVIFVISLTVFSAAMAKDLRLIEDYADEPAGPAEPEEVEEPTDDDEDPEVTTVTEEPEPSSTQSSSTSDPDNGSFQISLGLIPLLTALLCVTFQL